MRNIYYTIIIIQAFVSCKKGLTSYNDYTYTAINSVTYSYVGSEFDLKARCVDTLVFDTTTNMLDTGSRCYLLSATDGITHLEIKIASKNLKVGMYDLSTLGDISVYKYERSNLIGSPGSFKFQITQSDGKSMTGYFSGLLYNQINGVMCPISGDFSNIVISTYVID